MKQSKTGALSRREEPIENPIILGPFEFNWKTFAEYKTPFYEKYRKKLMPKIQDLDLDTSLLPDTKNEIADRVKELLEKPFQEKIHNPDIFFDSHFLNALYELLEEDFRHLENPLVIHAVVKIRELENWSALKNIVNILIPAGVGKGYEKHVPNQISEAYFVLIEHFMRNTKNSRLKTISAAFRAIQTNNAFPAGYVLKKSAIQKYHDAEKRVLKLFLTDSEIEELVNCSLTEIKP